MRFSILILYTLAYCLNTNAQPREKISLNSGWEFLLFPSTVTGIDQQNPGGLTSIDKTQPIQAINLPHTWNAKDILDETPGYIQNIGWYRNNLFIDKKYTGKVLNLYFEGACNKATVFINGQLAGAHNGGFTGFNVPITSYVKYGQVNHVYIKVDNSKQLSDSIPPFSGDFNLMGGIYRDVWLIATNPVRIEGLFGSSGVQFEISKINEAKAEFEVVTYLKGIDKPSLGFITYHIARNGSIYSRGRVAFSSNSDFVQSISGTISKPVLWSPENPGLYLLVVSILDEEGEIVDQLTQNIGFRWVGIGPNKEFLLNGKPYKLKGASRHQDYDGQGFALTDDQHWRDIKLMKEMGCNFIRIAHYPQDPAIYDACDKLGLISWSEIPVVDKVVNAESFHRNCETMMNEMVWQNFNHPSIAMWGYHNEVRNLDTATISNARRLERIAKQTDPGRLTAMAFESNFDNGYFENKLLSEIMSIPDIIGYNVYEGWYRGTIQTVPQFINKLHNVYPSKPMMLSEYGAGSSTGIHTRQPTIFDFSEEYQCLFQEPYITEGNKYPWMIGWGIWNFIDFQRDGREDVQPNINNKGMVTTDRKPKDVYYYYKANWSKEPFIYIAGKNWNKRVCIVANEKEMPKETITVYSNQPGLIFLHNGKPVQVQNATKGKYLVSLQVKKGINHLVCRTADQSLSDQLTIEYDFLIQNSFSEEFLWDFISFNTGQTRTFYRDHSNQNWLPDKSYTTGTWGYVGGTVYTSWPGNRYWEGIREGIHKPVMLTLDEPVYQTFVEGLTEWKADVPAGSYRISLYLCEPLTSSQRKNQSRVMSVRLNGNDWVNELELEKEYGILTAITLDQEILVLDDKGITISFIPHSGKTILNGVRIQKL